MPLRTRRSGAAAPARTGGAGQGHPGRGPGAMALARHGRDGAGQTWPRLVKAYLDHKSLAHFLNDIIIAAIAIVVIIMTSLLIMSIATTEVFVFISFLLLLVVFVFRNTCESAFEIAIFVFIMHPFDVGDRCIIDGIQMVVEEMNILTTVFLGDDNVMIYYPNSVLATKHINNLYRNPDMNDSVEFPIDFAITVETFEALKAGIKSYIDGKPQHWHPKHSVVAKDIISVNNINMVLYVLHTINHQNIPERNARRTELMLELSNIIQELSIRYQPAPKKSISAIWNQPCHL